MEMAWILARQILQMFLLAGLGYALFKTGKVSQDGSKAIGNILIYLVLPATIIKGFLVERTAEHLTGILYSAVGAAVLLLMSMAVSRLIFRRNGIAAFAGAFSNPGFFGIPLIIASVGEGAVFYVACFVAFLNIGQWTYGVSLLTGQPIRQGLQPAKLIRAPFVIAILIGLALFLTQPPLPAVITGPLASVAALNTPLAMFTVGIYLAQADIPAAAALGAACLPAADEAGPAAGHLLPGGLQRGGLCPAARQGLSLRRGDGDSLHPVLAGHHSGDDLAHLSDLVKRLFITKETGCSEPVDGSLHPIF